MSKFAESWCEDIVCPRCGAERNRPCTSYTGNTREPHKVRVDRSLRLRRERAREIS